MAARRLCALYRSRGKGWISADERSCRLSSDWKDGETTDCMLGYGACAVLEGGAGRVKAWGPGGENGDAPGRGWASRFGE